MVMDKLYENSETGCCPRFDPEPWDEKEVTFEDKLFVKDHVTSFFHIPLNFGKVMVRNLEMMYFFYTTCPKCAKVYGKNYTVLLAKV